MLTVLVILAAVAGLTVSLIDDASARGGTDATTVSVMAVRDAILGNGRTPGYLGDVGARPSRIADLLRKPSTVQEFDLGARTGWHGPYLAQPTSRYVIDVARGYSAAYGDDGDPVPTDGWARPIVLQIPDADGNGVTDADDRRHARLVSAGPDGIVSTPRTDGEALAPGTAHLPTRSQCQDDVVLYLHVADTRAP